MTTPALDIQADQAGNQVEAHIPLRRNLQFQTLWIGSVASTLGLAVSEVAYPLAILGLTGSPGRAGLFAAIQAIGMLVAGLPAGQLADQFDRRTIVIVAEAGQALLTGLVAVGLVFGWLSLSLLLVAAALLGAGQSFTGAARLPLVRSVVAPEQLTTALVQDEVRLNGAILAGPPLAGVLYAIRALAHAVPFLFTAGSFVLSLLAAVLMKVMPGGAAPADTSTPPEQEAEPSADSQSGAPNNGAAKGDAAKSDAAKGDAAQSGGMLTGLATIWSRPMLRAAMTLLMLVNTVGVGLDLAIIVLLRHQHVHSGVIGLVLAAGAVGGLVGAPLVKPLHRLRPGILLVSVCLVAVVVFALMALPFGPWWVAALMFVVMLGVPAIRVLVDVLVFRQTPDAERGRVIAAVMVLIGLGIPVGAFATGMLLQFLSATTALLVLAGVLAIAVALFGTRRDLVRARWPQ
jgi:MFS family permease